MRSLAWMLFLALGAPSVAWAHPCDDAQPGAGSPVRVPLGPADLGVQPEACASTMVALEGRAAMLIATDDFYGNLLAGAAVRGRVAFDRRSWVSFMVPGIDHRFVANATIEATKTGLGAGSLGVHHSLPSNGPYVLVPFARVLLPTETAFEHTTRWGFDQGISSVVRVRPDLELVGGYGVLVLATSGSERTHASLSPSLTLDGVYHPWRRFGIAAGASVRLVPADAMPFESFDPHLSLRLHPWSGAFATLSGVAPLFGRDRTNAALALALGWSWGP